MNNSQREKEKKEETFMEVRCRTEEMEDWAFSVPCIEVHPGGPRILMKYGSEN